MDRKLYVSENMVDTKAPQTRPLQRTQIPRLQPNKSPLKDANMAWNPLFKQALDSTNKERSTFGSRMSFKEEMKKRQVQTKLGSDKKENDTSEIVDDVKEGVPLTNSKEGIQPAEDKSVVHECVKGDSASVGAELGASSDIDGSICFDTEVNTAEEESPVKRPPYSPNSCPFSPRPSLHRTTTVASVKKKLLLHRSLDGLMGEAAQKDPSGLVVSVSSLSYDESEMDGTGHTQSAESVERESLGSMLLNALPGMATEFQDYVAHDESCNAGDEEVCVGGSVNGPGSGARGKDSGKTGCEETAVTKKEGRWWRRESYVSLGTVARLLLVAGVAVLTVLSSGSPALLPYGIHENAVAVEIGDWCRTYLQAAPGAGTVALYLQRLKTAQEAATNSAYRPKVGEDSIFFSYPFSSIGLNDQKASRLPLFPRLDIVESLENTCSLHDSVHATVDNSSLCMSEFVPERLLLLQVIAPQLQLAPSMGTKKSLNRYPAVSRFLDNRSICFPETRPLPKVTAPLLQQLDAVRDLVTPKDDTSVLQHTADEILVEDTATEVRTGATETSVADEVMGGLTQTEIPQQSSVDADVRAEDAGVPQSTIEAFPEAFSGSFSQELVADISAESDEVAQPFVESFSQDWLDSSTPGVGSMEAIRVVTSVNARGFKQLLGLGISAVAMGVIILSLMSHQRKAAMSAQVEESDSFESAPEEVLSREGDVMVSPWEKAHSPYGRFSAYKKTVVRERKESPGKVALTPVLRSARISARLQQNSPISRMEDVQN